jgi:hypothetical protein
MHRASELATIDVAVSEALSGIHSMKPKAPYRTGHRGIPMTTNLDESSEVGR